jgi:hypothetical protein
MIGTTVTHDRIVEKSAAEWEWHTGFGGPGVSLPGLSSF